MILMENSSIIFSSCESIKVYALCKEKKKKKETGQCLLTLAFTTTFTLTEKSKGKISFDRWHTNIYEYATTQFVFFQTEMYKLLTSKTFALFG